MLNNSKISGLIVVAILMAACQAVKVPEAYNFSIREAKSNPYGYWTRIEVLTPETVVEKNIISGELIAIEKDCVFLLADDGIFKTISIKSVMKAELITHRNQAGSYIGISLLYLAPNLIGAFNKEYGGNFLLLGIPVFIAGMIQTIIEGVEHKNILEYPGRNSLYELNKFSRFPSGIPEGIDLRNLTLKK